MLAYERLQTIIGREITSDELSAVAVVFKTTMNFFIQEESIKPWKIKPEPTTYELDINHAELNAQIFDKANKMNISPDELVSYIIKKYIANQCKVSCNE